MYEVLFVCTGNSCRSHMAEGILKSMLQKEGIDSIQVESAGTHAPQGMPPTQNAILTTIEHGIVITHHRALVLTSEMVNAADLILVMEKSHQSFIREHFPRGSKKVHLLKGFDGTGFGRDVEDPVGGDMEVYRACYEELEDEIKRILPTIINYAENRDLSEN